jgi:hypothetical protein
MSRGAKIALLVGALALLLVVGGFLVALFAGGLGAYWALREGAPGPSDEDEQIAGIVALGDGKAIFVQGYGISEPMLVRGVHLSGSALADDWRWRAPDGYGTYGWKWRTAAGLRAGELHPSQGEGPHRLAVFDADGFVGEVPRVQDGAWIFSEDGSALLVHEGDALALYRTAPFERAWRTPVDGPQFVARLGLTPTLAVLYDGPIRVFRRGDGSLVRTIADRELAGIDRARGELFFRRGAQMVVESLETGAERIVIDLAQGVELADGMEEPTLLGSHMGRWLFVYATELDHSFTSNGAPPWTRPAPRTLAAVDAESGVVVWRTALGPWQRWTPLWNQEIYDERELPSTLLYYSDADLEGGGTTGHLASIRLSDGSVVWQQDYQHATRGNALFARTGDVAYLRVRAPNEGSSSALVRFDAGRFTGAVRLPDFAGDVRDPMVLSGEAWAPMGVQSWALLGADMSVRATGGPAERPADARAFAIERLQLPVAAR